MSVAACQGSPEDLKYIIYLPLLQHSCHPDRKLVFHLLTRRFIQKLRFFPNAMDSPVARSFPTYGCSSVFSATKPTGPEKPLRQFYPNSEYSTDADDGDYSS